MRPAAPTSSPAAMDDAYKSVGYVITTTIAVMAATSRAVRRKHVTQPPNSRVKMAVVSPNVGFAMVNQIA